MGSPADEIAGAEEQRDHDAQQAALERTHSASERSRDRRSNYVLAGLSGLMVISGGVGSQLISRYDQEPPKATAYEIVLSENPLDCYSRNTVLKVNSLTGETWYARKRNDGVIEWVQISNDAQPSIPSNTEPCHASAKASPVKGSGR